jgi:hypothetical protein
MRCCMLLQFRVRAVARDDLEPTYHQMRPNQATAVQAAPGDIEAGCFLSKMSTGGGTMLRKLDSALRTVHKGDR